MIRVDSGEEFYVTTTLVDVDSMGSGKDVLYTIKNNSDAVIDSGALVENTTYSGIYSKNVAINTVGSYKVFYECTNYPTGVEDIIVTAESLSKLIKQTRQWNMATENVLATTNILARNVAIGKTDYIIIKIKEDAAIDWSSPIREEKVYAWYKALGNDQPYYIGEES
ncbi:MAG: hypothetical protein JRJ85_00665 [Deltaproteobacteria bacterium]|nr:hypothetical protein [Deltaproteobacteria bacterium]